jgi:hypothetical protein
MNGVIIESDAGEMESYRHNTQGGKALDSQRGAATQNV